MIGSLWRVPDASTALLMARFYQLWRRDGLSVADSLRRAQQWVRDTCNTEKQTHFPSMLHF